MNHKGFASIVILFVVLGLLAIGGIWYATCQSHLQSQIQPGQNTQPATATNSNNIVAPVQATIVSSSSIVSAKSNPALIAAETDNWKIYKSFDVRIMPDGILMAKYGPVVWGFANDNGECGACSRISMKMIVLNKNNTTSSAFSSGDVVDPGTSDIDLWVSPDWMTIHEWRYDSHFEGGGTSITIKTDPPVLAVYNYSTSTHTYLESSHQTNAPEPNPRHIDSSKLDVLIQLPPS